MEEIVRQLEFMNMTLVLIFITNVVILWVVYGDKK